MTTLRDALEGAFNAAESGSLESISDPPELSPDTADPPESTETTSETTPRTRDESGRFASKAKEGEEEAAVAETEEVKPTRKAPTSWKKDYWGQWDKLGSDPELAKLQDYIEQREGEFVKGVSAYRDEAMKAKDLQEAITPFLPILQQHNLVPAAHVRNLLSAHHTLSSGSPEQKVQAFQRLAMECGIPLQSLNGNADPQQFQMIQELNSLKSEFGRYQQTAQQREQAEMQTQIEAFKANAPHFEDVRETMAGLLQSGLANDLKTAYDKACRMNDDVWSRMQSEQTAEAQREAARKAAAKKAVAVSTRSNAPTGQKVAVNGDDIRSTLEAAFGAHAGGGRL